MSNIWKIGPSPSDIKKSEYLDKAFKFGFAALGWAETGDLSKIENPADLKNICKKLKYKGFRRGAYKQLWSFANDIKKGDIILQYIGLDKNKFRYRLGEVLLKNNQTNSPYYYVKRKAKDDFFSKNYGLDNAPHRIKVKWEKQDRYSKKIGRMWFPALYKIEEKDLSIIENKETFNYLINKIKSEKKIGIEDKIARICWNTNFWKKPSGFIGKSKNRSAYESQSGFGHEEWLLDNRKIIDGYHYGFIQAVGMGNKNYEGNVYNISLFSINSETLERWWIGKINKVYIIDEKEADKICEEYSRRGWIREMKRQIKEVGAETKYFDRNGFITNLKYKPEDLELLEEPLRFSHRDKAVKSVYYSTLFNKKREPLLDEYPDDRFSFIPGHKTRKVKGVANYSERKSEIDDLHDEMQENIFKQLLEIYGKDNVGTENPSGSSSRIDLVVKKKNNFIFYEFKTNHSLKLCIREALGQLLEYGYFPDKDKAQKLIIVSQNKITEDAIKYLKKMRNDFYVPVYYQQYNAERQMLDRVEY